MGDTSSGESTGGAWGPASSTSRGGPGTGAQTYSSITSINTSVRDKKNILEVRLEKQQGSKFNLTMEETENLLRRLNIDSSHLIGASACPEGRPVVLITLHPSVDITRFMYRNESYIVKEGVRTTTIRPEGKKDKVLKITGLHPNTKDQAVIKYLSAHGTVSTTERVIHHVFPGAAGSSLLAGKLNGNRSYVVDLKVPMGSFHIIDGEKVSVRYGGQEWTCARCHQFKKGCPGAAVARDCTADRVLLSAHMLKHWEEIGYKPDSDALSEVDETLEFEIQVGGKNRETNVIPESSLTSKYKSVIVKGFRPETDLLTIKEQLSGQGLPADYNVENIVRNEKTGSCTVNNLQPEDCLALIENMHRKKFLGRQVFVTSVVCESPVKTPVTPPSPEQESHQSFNHNTSKPKPVILDSKTGAINRKVSNSAHSLAKSPSKPTNETLTDDSMDGLVYGLVTPNIQDKIGQLGFLKRKSEGSPEDDPLSRKEKKILREESKRLKKLERKQELKDQKKDPGSTSF